MQSELIEDMVKSGDCRDRDLEDTIVNKVFGGVLWNKVRPLLPTCLLPRLMHI
jgi:hypothetical protein